MIRSAKHILHFSFLLFAILIAPFATQAAGLDGDDIIRWAESARSVHKWADQQAPAFSDELDAAVKPKGMDNMMGFSSMSPEQMEALSTPISNLVKGIRRAGKGGEFSAVIADHGFSSADRWGTLGDRVMKAYMTLELSEHGDPRAEMSGNLAELQSSPHLSDAQKQQMMGMMQGALMMLDLMANAPPEDVEAVRPHKKALKKAFSD